jgi:AcrR family transcriptional regulator
MPHQPEPNSRPLAADAAGRAPLPADALPADAVAAPVEPPTDVASVTGAGGRRPLTRDRVLRAALALADEQGIEAVSMRRLGQRLQVEAMSLYKHVEDKEAILDGIADLVMDEVEVPDPSLPWREAIRRSAISAHEALRRHPWAGTILESRLNPGPARLRYLDAVVGVLRGAGFDTPMVARAFMALDAHTYGFTLQELAMPFDAADAPEIAAMLTDVFVAYPNLQAMAELTMSGAQLLDFEFGLDLLLDGLERLLPAG